VLEPGSPAFQGRDDLFRTLESLLINSPAKIAPLLLGQPRTGKSSALRQLPQRLGNQVLSVYIDMERRSTATDAAGLMSDLAGAIRTAALTSPTSVALPQLDEALLRGDPYRVFENWIEEVERALGERRWLLIALDEFNQIDGALRRGAIDERIFAMIRSLIQHHPRVGIALCGTFTLAECDPRWPEALKSVRTIPVSFLKPDEARLVFTQPAPDFPESVYTPEAVNRALALSGGQPYLLHLIGSKVIDAYNRTRVALPPGAPLGTPLPAAAIDAIIPDVLSEGAQAFQSIWDWLLRIGDNQQLTAQLVRALARGEIIAGIGDPDQRTGLIDILCERDMIELDGTQGYRFRVPLMQRWIQKQRRLSGL